ncbi:hypothetical protein [Acuticoccus sp. I52.16.1]|uniref:hypothetical protein n=1 Tax=Acuticoccus sp. I52.16.1 TaxID=2928472 RepID=UPI001FD027C8|nr:hypothetical protein [Acuticoccus sp. I52.16.1]UOM35262.1 hypothetical protein MRB58_03375 [Acuticoccus sp. I52.16.1]
MRAMLLSFTALAAITVGAAYVLNSELVGWSSADRTAAADSVRLDPGVTSRRGELADDDE